MLSFVSIFCQNIQYPLNAIVKKRRLSVQNVDTCSNIRYFNCCSIFNTTQSF